MHTTTYVPYGETWVALPDLYEPTDPELESMEAHEFGDELTPVDRELLDLQVEQTIVRGHGFAISESELRYWLKGQSVTA